MNIEILPNIITFFFLIVILSYYILIFVKKPKDKIQTNFKSISIIIPAHNEEKYIAKCLDSVLNADFDGDKQIIVVDDGSKDSTSEIVSKYLNKGVVLIKQQHTGKSASMNKALEIAKGDAIAIVDADSYIQKDSILYMIDELSRENVGGVTGTIKVKNRKKFICIWVHIEQLYNSLIRHLFSKLNANISTPGPLSVYRKKALDDIQGFSTEGYSEDLDITIRLIRKGYKVRYAEKAVSETNMPYTYRWFMKQRFRFAKGMLNLFKRHIRLKNKKLIDIYTLPLFVFTYIQGVIMGSFTIYQIVNGYIKYFLSNDIIFNLSVVKFLFEWLSIVGTVKWMYGVAAGIHPLTVVAVIGVIATLLTYPLYLFSILKFDKKLDLFHIIALFFMAPFWLLIMVIYIISLPEMFKKKQPNVWLKND